MFIINQIVICPCDAELMSAISAVKSFSPEWHDACMKATPRWILGENDEWVLKCPACGKQTAPGKNQVLVRAEWNKLAQGDWVVLEL